MNVELLMRGTQLLLTIRECRRGLRESMDALARIQVTSQTRRDFNVAKRKFEAAIRRRELVAHVPAGKAHIRAL